MINTEKITSVELVDLFPLGDHRVIIDSFEKREYDDFTYLDFQLVGLEEEACDKEIKHGVHYPENGKATSRSKLGKLVKAALPAAKGRIEFENDLLQKEVMIRVVEDVPYLEVDAVWAVGQEPPVPSTEDNDESENEVSTDVEADEDHNSSQKNSSVPTV
mgnify:FL=1|jgi:hypothetical protein